MVLLYDVIYDLADSTQCFNDSTFSGMLIPVLMQKWESTPDSVFDVISLFECFQSVVVGAGSALVPFSKNMYDRCMAHVANVFFCV